MHPSVKRAKNPDTLTLKENSSLLILKNKKLKLLSRRWTLREQNKMKPQKINDRTIVLLLKKVYKSNINIITVFYSTYVHL